MGASRRQGQGSLSYLISKGGARLDKEGNQVSVSIPLKEWSHVLDCDKCYVTHLLNELIELDIIVRKNYLPGKVPEYFFNRRVDRWARRSVTLPSRTGRLRHGYRVS
ncbi:MAG: hypothetical protein M1269_12830 [Chloroflexi bacterium]|nr:hypothetical protein [Chloroflexota bacterium]